MTIKISNLILNKRKILNWETFAENINTSFWDSVFNDERLDINLEEINIINHDGLIWIVYILLKRKMNSLFTYITLPSEENKIAFIKYYGLPELQKVLNFTFINEYVLFLYEKEYKPKPITKMLKSIKLINGSNWYQINNQSNEALKNYILNEYNINPIGQEAFEELDPFCRTLEEFIQNIALHGGAEPGNGLGLVSFTPLPKEFNKIRYCFGDIGSGFLETINKKSDKKVLSHKNAIITGLLYRYYNPKDGIAGLYPTLKYIRKNNGIIAIRSGDAFIKLDFNDQRVLNNFDNSYRDNPTEEWLSSIIVSKKCNIISGTHILVELQIHR
jgi:hypothetical protein